MKGYVYSTETHEYVDIINGDTHAEIESQFEDKWGSNDYGLTYSTGLQSPRIGDVIPECDR